MCGCCRFAVVLISREEPLGADHGGELGAQHLERDLAIVPEVVRQVDRGHPALAQLALDPVAVGQRRGQPRARVAQRTPSTENSSELYDNVK